MDFSRPYFIAELSGNHNGSLSRAKEIIYRISKTGANAIKLQTLNPSTITLDLDTELFTVNEPSSPGMGALFTLYIRKVVLHGIGILKFSLMLIVLAWTASVLPLT